MDPNWNGQQWQQQYPDPNQQYAQPLQQQSTGTPQHGYSPVAQQTPSDCPSHQQGVPQPSYQSLMQQMPTQQRQQQPAHQYYNQGVGSNTSTTSATVGPWAQNQPSSQWQTATNNAATTTTTTTTTTKSSKETQISQPQPQYATSSTTLDFASMMQQAPPQPQPMQQQQAYNYSQTMQSEHQQQSLLPPAPDFSQFMQNTQVQTQNTVDFSQLLQNNPPPTQNTVDFSQLIQTAPPPPPPPQPQVSQAPPVVQTPVPPQKAKSSKQSSNSTNKTTTSTTTNVVGSSSRKEAAEKGKTELRRFDQEVSNKLKRFYDAICPFGYDYYATRQGYICGGGHHFFSHEDVEAMLKYGRHPSLEHVNSDPYGRMVTPPPGTGNGSGLEPLFWSTEEQSEVGYYPFACLKDPGRTPRLRPMNPYKVHDLNCQLMAWRATHPRH